jgi:peroxiredoxin
MSNAYVNQPFPSFELPRISGATLSTSDLNGKKVLYFWWGSW